MTGVIVIGKTGQLARALANRAAHHNIKITSFGRSDCDLSAGSTVIEQFANQLPACDGIILAAAYTAVDAAEDDRDAAFQVNGVAPGIFAKACAARDIPLVHISTDYVFPGDGNTPLTPDADTDPVNAYGDSKLAGEISVSTSGARAAILRTSWVFDGDGKNFMTTMLRLAQDRDALNIVADQFGRPTYAGDLADASLVAIKKLIIDRKFDGGTYHVSGTGPVINWADFADAIFTKAISRIPHTVNVGRIPSSAYPTPAKRPSYSVMDTSKFEREFSHALPSWEAGLDAAYQVWAKRA